MTNKSIRDFKRRKLAAQYELKRLEYRAIIQDLSLPYSVRSSFISKLALLPRNSSKTRVQNRCVLTGRPRSVLRHFRVSRIVFRELASKGLLAGVTKSSW